MEYYIIGAIAVVITLAIIIYKKMADPKVKIRTIEDIDATDINNLDPAISNNTDVAASKIKTDLITISNAVDLNSLDTANINNLDGAISSNADVTASKAKTDLISGTTPLDLDNIGGSQTAAQVPFTPSGDIGATDVQAALEELDSETLKTNTLNTITNNTQILNGANSAGLIINSSGNLSVLRGGNIELSIEPTGVSFTGLTDTLINSNGNNSPITKGYADANYLGSSNSDYNKSFQTETIDFDVDAIHVQNGNLKSIVDVRGITNIDAKIVDANLSNGDVVIFQTNSTGSTLEIVPNAAESFIWEDQTAGHDGVRLTGDIRQATLLKLDTNLYRFDGSFEGYQVTPPVTELNTLSNATSPSNEANATTGYSPNGSGGSQTITLESLPNTDSEGGAFMLKATQSGVGTGFTDFDLTGLTLGQNYLVSFRARCDSFNSQRLAGFWQGVSSQTNQDPNTTWTTYAQTVQASATTIEFRLYTSRSGAGLAGDNFYISSFSVTAV